MKTSTAHTAEEVFKGAITALTTDFFKVGRINFRTMERHILHQVRNGIRRFVIAGTTGQSCTLSRQQHISLVKWAVAVKRKYQLNIYIIAGTGSNSTDEAVYLTKEARLAGVDGILSLVPYGNCPSDEGLCAHYMMIKIAARDLPVCLYYHPRRTGKSFGPKLVFTMIELGYIQAIKYSDDKLGMLQAIINISPPGFMVLSGDDSLCLTSMKAGADGVISVTSNVAPRMVADMIDAVQKRDRRAAEEINYALQDLYAALALESNPGPVNYAMQHLTDGEYQGNLKLPMVLPTSVNMKRIELALFNGGYKIDL